MPRKIALTAIDGRILHFLLRHKRLSIRWIAKAAGRKQPTVRSALEKLQDAGLIRSEKITVTGAANATRKMIYALQDDTRELLESSGEETGLALLSKSVEFGDTTPVSPLALSLLHFVLTGNPFRLKKDGPLALSLRFLATMAKGIADSMRSEGRTTVRILKPLTPERQRAAMEEIIGEGPWYVGDEDRPVSRLELEAWLKDRMDLGSQYWKSITKERG